VFILNYSLTRTVDGKTPYKAWHSSPLVVHFMRTFGCMAYMKDACPNLKKLDDRSSQTVFVKYESGSKAYRCYIQLASVSLSPVMSFFDEGATWCWEDGSDMHTNGADPLIVEYTIECVHSHVVVTPVQAGDQVSLGFQEQPDLIDEEEVPAHVDLDADHDDTQLRFCSINEMVKDVTPSGHARGTLVGELKFTSAEVPTSFR
jgi:hypothetical protein